MGVNKYHALILTAQEDHNSDSFNYRQGGPKVHFDLAGYDILFWDPKDLDGFRIQLEAKIRQRQATAPSSVLSSSSSPWDQDWLIERRRKALAGLQSTGQSGYMELRFALSEPIVACSHAELLEAAADSQVMKSGSPIGIVLSDSDKKPRPRSDGIETQAVFDFSEFFGYRTYDYWYLSKNGEFYLLKSLFEDSRKPGSIFADTRIIRIAETLLYCSQLYERLGVAGTMEVNVGVSHGGLENRVMRTANPARDSGLLGGRSTTENNVDSVIRFPLSNLRSTLVYRVKDLAEPLFVLFDFFQPPDQVYEEIVGNFVEDRVR